MDIKDKLESLATSYGWRFVHARRDYANLTDALAFVEDEAQKYGVGETILFLDPVVRDGSKTDGIVYSGNFMVLTISDLDGTYDEKYKDLIEPLNDIVLVQMMNQLRCSYTVNQWRAIEVINVFDINADGLSVNFNLKG
jgi:hypothetical protein